MPRRAKRKRRRGRKTICAKRARRFSYLSLYFLCNSAATHSRCRMKLRIRHDSIVTSCDAPTSTCKDPKLRVNCDSNYFSACAPESIEKSIAGNRCVALSPCFGSPCGALSARATT